MIDKDKYKVYKRVMYDDWNMYSEFELDKDSKIYKVYNPSFYPLFDSKWVQNRKKLIVKGNYESIIISFSNSTNYTFSVKDRKKKIRDNVNKLLKSL
jgi:hypothetical protein